MASKLQELQIELGRFIYQIQDYRTKYGKEWNDDHEAHCQKILDDYNKKSEEYEKLEAEQKRHDNWDALLAGLNDKFNKPSDKNWSGVSGGEKTLNREMSKEELTKIKKDAYMEFLRGWCEGDRTGAYQRLTKFGASHGFGPEESLTFVVEDPSLGGYLAPEEFRAELIKNLPTVSQVLSLVRHITSSGPSVILPRMMPATAGNLSIYPSGYSGAWVAEADTVDITAATVQNQPTWGEKRVVAHKWKPNITKISYELMRDSKIDIEAEIRLVIRQTLGLDLDAAIVNGSGVGRPKGLLQAGLTTVESGDDAILKWEGLMDLIYSLPPQYASDPSCAFLMNRATYGKLFGLKNATGDYIIPYNVTPNTLHGFSVKYSQFMPSVAAGNKPIIFGAFSNYIWLDRDDLMIIPIKETFAPDMGLQPVARYGGDILIADAFRVQLVNLT